MRDLLPESAAPGWDLRLLSDGDCPLCSREVAMLRRRGQRARIEAACEAGHCEVAARPAPRVS